MHLHRQMRSTPGSRSRPWQHEQDPCRSQVPSRSGQASLRPVGRWRAASCPGPAGGGWCPADWPARRLPLPARAPRTGRLDLLLGVHADHRVRRGLPGSLITRTGRPGRAPRLLDGFGVARKLNPWSVALPGVSRPGTATAPATVCGAGRGTRLLARFSRPGQRGRIRSPGSHRRTAVGGPGCRRRCGPRRGRSPQWPGRTGRRCRSTPGSRLARMRTADGW